MIEVNNKVYRNIQEQVQKNKEDIAGFKSIQFTLNNFGITVLGIVETEQDIPERTYHYGDAWLVGASEPYDIFIYTRSDVEGEGVFVNMGPLTITGPQGPQGPQGIAGTDGTNGVDGTSINGTYGSVDPVISGTENDGDIYINTTTNYLWMYENNQWNRILYIRGAQGIQGETGPQGATGTSLSVVGILESSTLLPTNFESGTIPKNSAYLIPNSSSTGYDLWIILGQQDDYSTWYWSNAGAYPNSTDREQITDMYLFQENDYTVEYDTTDEVAVVSGTSSVTWNDGSSDLPMTDLPLPIKAGDNVSIGVDDAGKHLVISAQGGVIPNDYIIEHGTTNDWNWRKWNSGVFECWIDVWGFTTGSFSAWGSLYNSSSRAGGISYPITFSVSPYCNIATESATSNGWWFTDGGGTNTTTPYWRYIRPTTAGNTTVNYKIYAIGKTN